MHLYPEQLRQIAALCEALDKIEQVDGENSTLVLQQRIAVVEAQQPADVYGHLVDEIGGAWSFAPLGVTS